MFKINDEKIIHIADKDYSMNDLIVIIPEEYIDLFRKVRFKNKSEFSRALMFANCANEAKIYHRSDLVKQNEVSLNWFITNRGINNAHV